MSDAPEKKKLSAPLHPWGYMENGTFIEVPWLPLVNAGVKPPIVVTVHSGERLIIEKPA